MHVRSTVLALAVALCTAISAPSAGAQALTSAFTYQGELRALGVPANASYDMELRLYDAATNGNQLGPTLAASSVAVSNGLFALQLDFGAVPFAGDRQWLEIRIKPAGAGSYETLIPRTEITAAPYALASARALANSVTGTSVVNGSVSSVDIADGGILLFDLADGSVSGAKIVDGTVSGSDLAPDSVSTTRLLDGGVLAADLADNAVSGAKIADGSVSGSDLAADSVNSSKITDGSVALVDLAANSVNAARIVDGSIGIADVDAAQVQARVSSICAAGSSISAIGANGSVTCEPDDTGVPGWSLSGNVGTNPSTQFIGTLDNQPLDVRVNGVRALRLQPNATSANLLGGFASAVNPGVVGATIGGGGRAGDQNVVTDDFGTIGGGLGNTAGGESSTVGGGGLNNASGYRSVIGGGGGNVASGGSSTVGGGAANTASGLESTVAGGTFNCAGGQQSWAGGRNAKVRPGSTSGVGGLACGGVPSTGTVGDAGTFVWADAQTTDFISTGSNQFLVRAQGGMAINTNAPAPGASLTVNGSIDVSTSGSLGFGSQTRQMLNLWGPEQYGIGVQASRLYYRTAVGGGFSWFEGGAHNDAADNPGTGGTLRMRLSSTGQLQTTTGTISTLSDARLKQDVHEYTGALDQINALRPVHYTYIDGGKADFQPAGDQLGFIAQEMQQVFPQWVGEDDHGRLMLSMRGFEAVAVRGMQELSAENAALRERLDDLQQRLEALEGGNRQPD